MKNFLSYLVMAVLIALIPTPSQAATVTRYSSAVPAGAIFTAARGGLAVELRSPSDEQATAGQDGAGTLPLLAGESTLTTTWVSGGIVRTVETTRRANEGGANGAHTWAVRHHEAEQAALQLWPPDPPSTG
jgi:hypothetical protein